MSDKELQAEVRELHRDLEAAAEYVRVLEETQKLTTLWLRAIVKSAGGEVAVPHSVLLTVDAPGVTLRRIEEPTRYVFRLEEPLHPKGFCATCY